MESTTHNIGLTDAQLAASKDGVDPAQLRTGQQQIEKEKLAKLRQIVTDYRPAVFWSLIISCALVMEGYDLVITGSFWGQPTFQKFFGEMQKDGSYAIPANWITIIGNISNIGTLIGLSITGYCQERFGSKKTYLTGMAIIICLVPMSIWARNLRMLLASGFLFSIPMGMFQTLTTAYAAEISPVNLRGILASFVNMAWGIGIFLSSGVAKGALGIEGNWSWRMPFALQWIWPIPLMLGAFWAPESPWWLVRKGRLEDAKHALMRTARPGYYDDKDLDGHIALMKHTDDVDRAESAKGSYLECFRGSNLRRTEIMFGVWAVQVWGGQGITGLTVLFFESAGLGVEASFDLNLALNSMFIIGTIVSWCLLPYFGRRPIYLVGLSLTSVSLLVIGIIACLKSSNAGNITTGVFMIFINFLYNCSIGPLCYSIAGELPSSRLRSRSIVMGRMLYIVGNIINGQLVPRMLSKDAWNIGAKSAFYWLGTNLLCIAWCFFRLPETGGFTFAELDILFANKTPTRQFHKMVISDVQETTATSVGLNDFDKKYDTDEHVERVTTLH